MLELVDQPEECCNPVETHAETESCQNLWHHGGPHCSSLLLKHCTIWKGSKQEQFVKKSCSL